MDSTSRSLQCVIVTPERAVLDQAVDFVALPMYDGELGALPGRAPLIGRLGYGELRIRHGNQTTHFYVDSGFAQIRNNVVTVLTPRALRASEIDMHAAQDTLTRAEPTGPTSAAQTELEKNQQRARAQIRIASRSRGESYDR